MKTIVLLQTVSKLEYTEKLNKLDFNSLLIKPIQRLPKYVLLFKDLLKHTPEDHPDYKNIWFYILLKKFNFFFLM